MGLDARDLPATEVVGLSERLRAAGYEVDVVRESHPRLPDIEMTRLSCRRGKDTQVLVCLPKPELPGEYRVYIPNAWSWWRTVHERRTRLQEEITSIIEQSGGRSLFPDRGDEPWFEAVSLEDSASPYFNTKAG